MVGVGLGLGVGVGDVVAGIAVADGAAVGIPEFSCSDGVMLSALVGAGVNGRSGVSVEEPGLLVFATSCNGLVKESAIIIRKKQRQVAIQPITKCFVLFVINPKIPFLKCEMLIH